MFSKEHPFIAGAIAIVAGVCMVRGIVSVLPTRIVYNLEDSLTFIGGSIYWLGFIATAAGALHLMGIKGGEPRE